MLKKFFDLPVSAFRQAASSQFIGRGVSLVMAAARGFVVANIRERTGRGEARAVGNIGGSFI
jgi:hypothetical protein